MTHIKFSSLSAITPPLASKRPFTSCAFITLTLLALLSASNTALADRSGPPGISQALPCGRETVQMETDMRELSPSDFYNKYNTSKPPIAGTNTYIDYNFTKGDDGTCSFKNYTINAWDTTVTGTNGIKVYDINKFKDLEDEDLKNALKEEGLSEEEYKALIEKIEEYKHEEVSERDRDYIIDLDQETKDNINKGVIAYNNIAPIYNRIDDIEKGYRASTAGMAAMVNIPQVTRAGANLLAVGVGHFKGESAVAVGFSSASDNESLIFKISGSANTQHDVAIGSGLGYQW